MIVGGSPLAAFLSFSGTTVPVVGAAGPHFTLAVRNAPAGITYTFAKTADPSAKFTLTGANVTIDTAAAGGPYSASFTATPSDSPTHPTLPLSLQATVVSAQQYLLLRAGGHLTLVAGGGLVLGH